MNPREDTNAKAGQERYFREREDTEEWRREDYDSDDSAEWTREKRDRLRAERLKKTLTKSRRKKESCRTGEVVSFRWIDSLTT